MNWIIHGFVFRCYEQVKMYFMKKIKNRQNNAWHWKKIPVSYKTIMRIISKTWVVNTYAQEKRKIVSFLPQAKRQSLDQPKFVSRIRTVVWWITYSECLWFASSFWQSFLIWNLHMKRFDWVEKSKINFDTQKM